MGSSPDLVAARQVAKHLGTDHHEVIFTEGDVVECLDSVIRTLETFDITTIRASIGMMHNSLVFFLIQSPPIFGFNAFRRN